MSAMEANHSADYAKFALAFANALVDGDFDDAHAMLSSSLGKTLDPDSLRANYEEMVEYGDDAPDVVQLITTMELWPERQADDLGWAYVAITGDDFSEAVTVIVALENGQPHIRHVEWGRP